MHYNVTIRRVYLSFVAVKKKQWVLSVLYVCVCVCILAFVIGHANHSFPFDLHVTVHRVKFLIIKPNRCTNFSNLFLEWNSTCFGQFPRPSSGVFSLYTQQWYMSYRFVDCLRAGSGWNCSSIPILVASCQQTCMTYHCYVYSEKILMMDRGTVRNM